MRNLPLHFFDLDGENSASRWTLCDDLSEHPHMIRPAGRLARLRGSMSDFDSFIAGLKADAEQALAAKRLEVERREAEKVSVRDERRQRLLREFQPLMEEAAESCNRANIPAQVFIPWEAPTAEFHDREWIRFSIKGQSIKTRAGGVVSPQSPVVFCQINKHNIATVSFEAANASSPMPTSVKNESDDVQNDLDVALKGAIAEYFKTLQTHEF